ncbi:MAG: poly(3-hydroxyalkanoate) depolymerase [Candidatus Azotimanducaceae bacterium]|jgi:poly(3-hydroxyalkanoate) depolymerase
MTIKQTLDIQWLTVDGMKVRVAVHGCDSDDLPLLIFNGIGASMELLLPFIQAMQGTQVIVYDAPGAGQSEPPRFPWCMDRHALLATKILDTLGHSQVNAIGVSWGGILAQQFARAFPHRCKRLILAATTPGVTMVPGKLRVLLRMSNPRRYRDRDYMREIAGEIYGGSLRTDTVNVREHANVVLPPSIRGYYYQSLAVLGSSSLPWLHKLKQPTLVLQGEDDPLVPKINGRILAAMIPNAHMCMVDCGHLFLITRAQEIAPCLQKFLRQPLPTPGLLSREYPSGLEL